MIANRNPGKDDAFFADIAVFADAHWFWTPLAARKYFVIVVVTNGNKRADAGIASDVQIRTCADNVRIVENDPIPDS